MGGGKYVDDISLKGELFAAFLRSPYAHAQFTVSDVSQASALPGVFAVYISRDLEPACRAWQCRLMNAPELFSPEQRPLADKFAVFQGEPIAMVVARSRAIAEDALELIEVEWSELPAILSMEAALAPDAAKVHSGASTNLCYEFNHVQGLVNRAFEAAAFKVTKRLRFNRKTGVPLEPRSILASFEPGSGSLVAYMSHQMPHQMQLILSDLLDIPLGDVRVVCPDVGGGFGIKMHVYPEEMAVCAASKILGRPVKYIADRVESMLSDVHAREHVVEASMAIDADGLITAMKVDDIQGLGAFSIYPRSSTAEGMSALRAMGAAYNFEKIEVRLRSALQNKVPVGQYRSVGHPIAVAVTEDLVEEAAFVRNESSLDFRRRNFVRSDAMPWTSPMGVPMMDLSHHACLERLLDLCDYKNVVAQVAAWREAGRVVGFGVASFVEFTATGPEGYGRGGVAVSSIDSVVITIDPKGNADTQCSAAEIGQGIQQGLAQIIADAIGLPIADVRVSMGDTGSAPHGGGAWSSRGAAITGEVAWQAGLKMRSELVRAAAAMLQSQPEQLTIVEGVIIDRSLGQTQIRVSDLARMVYFTPYDLPDGLDVQLTVSHVGGRGGGTFLPTNGIQASLVEIDVASGQVHPLKHWVVEDCGRIINPLLVDEQIRGGVVQGIGEALYEQCKYNEDGQFASGTLADYLLPMAANMPDIIVSHIETPFSGSTLGAKGAGEAGTCAAPAAVLNAVNDALRSFGGRIDELPITPFAVLRAMGEFDEDPSE
ncbi:MAG: hypothetical protein JWP84_2924 [Tardiphaga sp.]|nr:hypothetical protein [Tardiphaga sp.]